MAGKIGMSNTEANTEMSESVKPDDVEILDRQG